MRRLTEEQWLRKARQHIVWQETWLAEMEPLEVMINEANDPQLIQRIIDRMDFIQRRSLLLTRIMHRHVERAPPSTLANLRRKLH